jgi:sugar/nucleoside kinase (ribokinase family)
MKLVPKFLFIGGLRKDYCITPDQRIISGTLGGNAVYSAIGARVWTDSVAILSRIGSDYPMSWLDQLNMAGIETRWVKILTEPQQSITFYAYLSLEERVDTNPIKHYARINKPMPKELIGYTDSTSGQDSRNEYYSLSVRPSDIEGLEKAPAGVHLAPAEFLTHSTIPYTLKSMGVDILTLDPSERYMTPEFRFDLPKLIRGLDAFIPSEMEARSFFAPNTFGMWEMAERFAEMGCRYVVIKIGARGQILFDTINNVRWEIPAYPAQVRDVTGAGDSYCGGFLVGLTETADPLEAALMGTVSASLTIEGTGALYALGRTPGLAHSRIKALRTRVRRI